MILAASRTRKKTDKKAIIWMIAANIVIINNYSKIGSRKKTEVKQP